MHFDREDRPQVLPSNQRQELPEGEIPFSHRKVLIGRAVVIVEMDLTQPVAEHLYPLPVRRTSEGVRVPGIETESDP
jgi:hypothetical protein